MAQSDLGIQVLSFICVHADVLIPSPGDTFPILILTFTERHRLWTQFTLNSTTFTIKSCVWICSSIRFAILSELPQNLSSSLTRTLAETLKGWVCCFLSVHTPEHSEGGIPPHSPCSHHYSQQPLGPPRYLLQEVLYHSNLRPIIRLIRATPCHELLASHFHDKELNIAFKSKDKPKHLKKGSVSWDS